MMPLTTRRSSTRGTPCDSGKCGDIRAICDLLAPSLTVGDIVIADNLASHKIAGVREAIEARGASLWFLPPYSPDLNPIEQAFAKLKQFVRSAAPRTRETLWDTLGFGVARFSANECRNFFEHAAYAHSA
jgi:transposase